MHGAGHGIGVIYCRKLYANTHTCMFEISGVRRESGSVISEFRGVIGEINNPWMTNEIVHGKRHV